MKRLDRIHRRIRRFVKREPVRALAIVSVLVPLVAARLGVDGNQLLALAVAVLGINTEVARSAVSPVEQ